MGQAGKCLMNNPWTNLQDIELIYNSPLPGQYYSADKQCQFSMGPKSNYAACSVRNFDSLKFFDRFFI